MSAGERTPLLEHAGKAGGSRHGAELVLNQKSEIMKQYAQKFCRDCCSVENVKNKFPISKWLPQYRLPELQSDIISGLTVALTVIPQGLAYAKIANLPPQYGLYSAFMGCFVYLFLGTSKDITLGPTAIMSLMTAAFATSPVENDPTYAIILTLMVGVVQFAMGVCHLGIIVSFISYPVINAFTSAAAITIAFGQIKGILGLQHIPRDFLEMVYETCKHIPDTKVWDLTMGLASLIILFLLKKLRTIDWKDAPDDPPLNMRQKVGRKTIWLCGTAANAVVVISAAGIAAILHSQGMEGKLSLTGEIKAGLPPFQLPAFSLQNGNETLSGVQILKNIGTGLGIVPLLGLVEAIAIGKAFARQNNYKIIPNQELIAIDTLASDDRSLSDVCAKLRKLMKSFGAANIISCFVSSYPITGSFSRTAVNSQCGVRTPASGIFTGAVVLLALQVLTPLFYYIPKAALSAVIISAVIQMVDYKIVKKLWDVQKLDLVPLFTTFISSLVIGIEYGILVGIGVSILMLLFPLARPKVQTHYLDAVVVSFSQGLQFPAVEYVQSKVLQAAEGDEKPRSVIMDCTHLSSLDYTTIQGIIELEADFQRREVPFVIACLQPALLAEVKRADIPHLLCSPTVEEAFKVIKEAQKSDELLSITVDVVNSETGHVNGGFTDSPSHSAYL